MAKYTGAVTSTQKSEPLLGGDVKDNILRELAAENIILDQEVAAAAPVEGEIVGGVDTGAALPTSYDDPAAYPQNAGLSPQGDVLPLRDRAGLALQGNLNPLIGTQAAGSENTQPMITGSGEAVRGKLQFPTHRSLPDKSPLMEITNRANTVADGLVDRTMSGNWHFHGDDAPAMAEYRRTGQATDEVKSILQKRAETNSLAETITLKIPNAVTVDPSNGQYAMNRDFAKLMAITTENHLHDAITAAEDVQFDPDNDLETLIDDTTADPEFNDNNKAINPIDSASKLGRDILKWHDSEQRANGEMPTPALSDKEYKEVGAMALQAYKLANPDLIAESKDPITGGTRYQLTPKGEAEFNRSTAARSDIFNVKVPPSHYKPQDGQLPEGLGQWKPQYRNLKAKEVEVVNESVINQSSVNHLVDQRRTRIAMAMIIPTMFRAPGAPNDHFGEVFGVGETSLRQSYIKETRLKDLSPQDANKEASRIVMANKKTLLKQLTALSQNYRLPNYLTYAVQPLTTRAHAQQTDFNPTRNKVVRFATRGQSPTKVTKGSKTEDGLLTVFALNLLDKDIDGVSDALNPQLRIEAARERLPKWYQMGRALRNLLDESIPAGQFEQMIEAIKQNIPLDDPRFPQGAGQSLKLFGDKMPEDIRQLMNNKGEDGPMALDTLLEVVEYMDNMEKKGEHHTYQNAYIDGKTNGIALSAAILGNEALAYRTGILRPVDAIYAVQDEDGNPWDVRDAMKASIQGRIGVVEDDGTKRGKITTNPHFSYSPYKLPGNISEERRQDFLYVMHEMGGYKALNKNISMVFPYGKELGGMINEVQNHFMDYMGDAKNEEFRNAVERLEKAGVKMDSMLAAVHYNVTNSLFEVFGKDTFEGRSMMRTSAAIMAAMDYNFAVDTPDGFRVNLSGIKVDTSKAKTGSVTVANKETGERSTLKTQTSPTYRSAAAERNGQIGGSSNRLSVVIPVHAADAMTMHRTLSGDSMQRIRDNYSNPDDAYITQIYDAVKVDPANVDTVYKEINKNFMKVAEEFNYFERAYQAVTDARKKFRDEMSTSPQHQFPISRDGQFSFIYDMIVPTEVTKPDGSTGWSHNGLKTFAKSVLTPRPGETSQDYNNRAKAWSVQFGNMLADVVPGMGKPHEMYGAPPATLSGAQLVQVMELMFKAADYSNTQTQFLSRINKQRRDLFRKSRELEERTGWGPSQFHAH